jgi:hypothetical protein
VLIAVSSFRVGSSYEEHDTATANVHAAAAITQGRKPAARPDSGPGNHLYASGWSSPMHAFPASGQPPAVIFCVQGTTRAADRTLQQRLSM